jgi:hypothetical protein
MTTAPYAKLRANIAGAGNLTGALVGAAGASCQLSQDPAGLGSSFKYEITDYPEGFACPSGWTDANGVYTYLGLTPPVFTLPALTLWGKLPLRLTVNNGDPGTSGLPKTQFVDESTVISVPGPSAVRVIAYLEKGQWDARRKWVGELNRDLRLLALIAAGYKGPVRCATAAALAAYTRVGGVITANANGAIGAIDTSVSLAVGDRLLLKNGASGTDNGIYVVTSLGDAGAPFVLTRAEDWDESADVKSMCIGAISEGTANGGKQFKLTTANPIVLGTTALSFTVF